MDNSCSADAFSKTVLNGKDITKIELSGLLIQAIAVLTRRKREGLGGFRGPVRNAHPTKSGIMKHRWGVSTFSTKSGFPNEESRLSHSMHVEAEETYHVSNPRLAGSLSWRSFAALCPNGPR